MLLCLTVAIQVHGVKKRKISGKVVTHMTVSIKKNVINANSNTITKNENCQTSYNKCIENINKNLLSCKIAFSRCYQEIHFTQNRQRRSEKTTTMTTSTPSCEKTECDAQKKICNQIARSPVIIFKCNLEQSKCRRCRNRKQKNQKSKDLAI